MEISLPLVIGAGILSFLSPCVLPLVPPYLTYMSGASFEQLRSEEGSAGALQRRAAVTSLFFISAFRSSSLPWAPRPRPSARPSGSCCPSSPPSPAC